MEETAVIANLPNLEIKVIHREAPEDGAEIIAVQLKAKPSFQALARGMDPALMAPVAWAAPFSVWSMMAEQFWRDWWKMAGHPWMLRPPK